MFTAGVQVPVIVLLEVPGNVNAVPEHFGVICVNVGVVLELTAMVIEVTFAHCPAVGVKVYVVVAVLFKAGNHVPVILLLDVNGKAFKVPPIQMALTCIKVGVTIGLTSIVIVTAL